MAKRRAEGHPPYNPSAPKTGGFRVQGPQAQGTDYCTTVLQRLSCHRHIRVLPMYRRYSQTPALQETNGFDVLNLWSYAEADIVVVERMSDIDLLRNEHLVSCMHLLVKHFLVFLTKVQSTHVLSTCCMWPLHATGLCFGLLLCSRRHTGYSC